MEVVGCSRAIRLTNTNVAVCFFSLSSLDITMHGVGAECRKIRLSTLQIFSLLSTLNAPKKYCDWKRRGGITALLPSATLIPSSHIFTVHLEISMVQNITMAGKGVVPPYKFLFHYFFRHILRGRDVNSF